MKKLWWKFKSLVLFLKLQCLLLKWTLYHICHKCMESCYLKEWILINQLLFSVWISKASCWNEFHYDMVSLFLKEFMMRIQVFSPVSFIISHSSLKFFQLKWTIEHLITHFTMIWNTVSLKKYSNSDILWILIRNSSKNRIQYNCEMCDKKFILTAEKIWRQDLNSHQKFF